MKTYRKQELFKIGSLTALLSFTMLFAPAIFAQDSAKSSFQTLEMLQDENMKNLKQIYAISNKYPSFGYEYTIENGELQEAIVYGVNHKMDKKRLEVLLYDYKTNKNIIKDQKNRIGVVYSVDKEPEPEKGMKEFRNDLKDAVNYPDKAKKYGIDGTIYVKAVINEKGEISYITADEDLEATRTYLVEDLKEEAISAVKEASGTWIPGECNGQTVSSLVVIPVTFDHQKDPFLPTLIM